MSTVTLTENAVKEIKKIMEDQKLASDKTYLRAGVKGGGCSGFSWVFNLDENYDENKDLLEEQDGLKIVMDKRSAMYLQGTTVDYYDDGLMKRGFVFKNEAVKTTCGCGSSFSME